LGANYARSGQENARPTYDNALFPSPKSNACVQLPPLSLRIVVFLPSASLWDSWVRPHLRAPSLGMCAPSLGVCAPSLGMCAPSLVRALTWHVGALTWHVRAITCARPHLARARPRLACARPRLACGCPHLCASSLGMCAPSLVHALNWHVHAVTCARRLLPALSKKQCRCPTTPLIYAYCCLFAFR
jgi:hypothetical protein